MAQQLIEEEKLNPKDEDEDLWEILQKLNKDELLLSISKKNKLKNKIEDMNEDLIRKYIFWYNFDRKPICDKIQKVMKEKN